MRDASAYRADRFLERALLSSLLVHGVAMLTMVPLLLPALPGGGAPSDLSRVSYIAAHPWRFRFGWLPWQLCALSDVWLAVALLRVRWVPRAGAVLVLLCTVAGVIPDQGAQILWMSRGIELSRAAASSGNLGAYLQFERVAFECTAGWGALSYTLAALGWTWCFVSARVWNRWLTGLSLLLWPLMLGLAAAPLLPTALRLTAWVLALGNALGFVLLEAWFALIAEAVLRRARPFLPHGRAARWRHPKEGALGRVADVVANSRLCAALGQLLPLFEMVSDVTDVIYVNYLVPTKRLLRFVPEGLELQQLGPDGAYSLFTFLTFRHRHFGFGCLGPLRRLFPSSTQSNWRIHVRDPRTGISGIYFVSNATTSTLHAMAARLLTQGMPMHVLHRGEVRRAPGGEVQLNLDPGSGSASDAVATLRPCPPPELPAPFGACFASFRDFLAYCVPQDRAMSTQPELRRVTRHEIDLGIPLSACEPMAGEVASGAARAIVEDAAPLCFRVPSLRFHFAREAHDPLP
jgi:hypothetical protein